MEAPGRQPGTQRGCRQRGESLFYSPRPELAQFFPTLVPGLSSLQDPGKGRQPGQQGAGGGGRTHCRRGVWLPQTPGSPGPQPTQLPGRRLLTSSSSVTVFLQLCSRVVKLDVVGEL